MNSTVCSLIEEAGLHPGKDAAIKLENFARALLEMAARECEKSQGGDGRKEARNVTSQRCAKAIRALLE